MHELGRIMIRFCRCLWHSFPQVRYLSSASPLTTNRPSEYAFHSSTMLGEAFQDPNRPIAAEMAKASRTGDIELMQNILHRNQNIKKRLLDNAVSAAIDARQVDVLE